MRRHYRFYGRVQGVGFRYRAQYAAQSRGVTRWVKNEWDGTVAMEAQGTRAQIQRLLALVQQGTYVFIDSIDSRDVPLKENERNFQIQG